MTVTNVHARKKILIVEDEPNIVRGIKDGLEFEGLEVVSTSVGKEGVRVMREKGADCVILDLMLPRHHRLPSVRRDPHLQQRGADRHGDRARPGVGRPGIERIASGSWAKAQVTDQEPRSYLGAPPS